MTVSTGRKGLFTSQTLAGFALVNQTLLIAMVAPTRLLREAEVQPFTASEHKEPRVWIGGAAPSV